MTFPPSARHDDPESAVLILSPPQNVTLGLLAAIIIQDVVLPHEDGVVEHGDVAQHELDGVPRDAGPGALQPGVDAQLADAEHAAGHVEQDLRDGPALGGAVAVVRDDLRRELDDGDEELDVADGVGDVKGAPAGGVRGGRRVVDAGRDESDGQEAAEREAEDGPRGRGRGDAETPLREAVLRGGDEGEEEGVGGEGDVVELDGGGQAAVAEGVLLADYRGVVEGPVGEEVRKEACGVSPVLAFSLSLERRRGEREGGGGGKKTRVTYRAR